MKTDRCFLAPAALVAVLALPVPSFATVDISQMPVSAKAQATPNIIFGVDDSGSMDWEIMIPTPSGILYWGPPGYERQCTGSGRRRTCVNVQVSDGGFTTQTGIYRTSGDEYGYLFPNGYGASDTRNYTDTYAAVPPLPAFGFIRSHEYNPMYYNPAVTYKPWEPAWINGALRSFGNATPAAARSHPWYPTWGSPVTVNLTATLDSTSSYWTFRLREGMSLGGTSGVRTKSGFSSWTNRASNWVADGDYDAAIPYFPATYWIKDATCTAASVDCSTAPDGARLRRIEIKPNSPAIVGGKFPSGRTYDDEIQNFANWFQYYRKRKLVLASAMSSALSSIKGIRGDTVYFNDRNPVTMRDFSSDLDDENGKVVLGSIYANPANGGTPTTATLKYIGEQFRRTGSSAPIQFSCQRNAAFVLTDGYANDIASQSVPSYTRSTWNAAPPYTTIFDRSLADLASAYYTINLRPDMSLGMLSIDPSDASPNADKNTNLHMQTFAITMGAVGTIFGDGSPEATNPFVNPPDWPSPTNDSPRAIDDLWHATINGRGSMYSANNAEEVTAAMQDMVRKILVAAGSDAGVAVSTVNLRDGDNTAFVSSYNARNWTGDIATFPIDIATGNVDTSPGRALWSARALLDARTPDSRIIASHDGAGGVPFTALGLGSTLVGQLARSGTDGSQVLAWLRGDRSGEGTTYRARDSLLGDIVTAEPLYLEGIVYQAANDGMLHAFDASNGAELWAYVPFSVLPKLKRLADPLYTHEFFVDGTPTAAKILNGSRTILVGGLRAGGAGFYALDITQPRVGDEATLASKVLWEFPNASTPAAVRDRIGMSFGKPVIVKTASAGWVVLLTSGYNGASGGGHLFVLDAVTGALLKTISTPSGSGLAQVSAWVDDPAGAESLTNRAYAGDLDGNLWRFDLSGSVSSWNVSLLVALGPGKPITTAPELARVDEKRVVLFGTGRLLGESDLVTAGTQSVYGIADRGSTISDPTNRLYRQILTEAAGGVRHVTSNPFDWTAYDGWRFDLPAGERVSTDPSVAFGALVFTSNKPSPNACSTESFLYAVNVATGGQMPPSVHFQQPWSGKRLGFAYSSRPVTVTLPSGKVVAITHKSDTTVASSLLPVGTTSSLRKLGWREVFR